ncbi:biotin--[acetyl-CoA-carboxylase] ligase [Thiomicrorhabdus sediminis]|nr:biotin--[acetyl-CoA-carboxylase] ligase [Thiomicrorhabdus sediminis]
MPENYQLIELDSVDSTNRYLKDYCRQQLPDKMLFCQTHRQTAGYGQLQRSWSSNKDSLIFSIAYPLATKQRINGLVSLHLASLIQQTLVSLNPTETIKLKWPNDLYNAQGKIAGILIEQVIKNDYQALIIGVGINRQSEQTHQMLSAIEQVGAVAFFDDQRFFQTLHDKLIAQPLTEIDYDDLHGYWQAHDYFAYQETLQLIEQQQSQLVQYIGIDEQGAAQVLLEHQLKTLSSGQSSLRKLN